MSETKTLGWPIIIGIMLATAIVTGLIVGVLGIGQNGMSTAITGGVTGAVGVFLMSKRKQA